MGRMLVMVARRMGYRTVVYSPDVETPAGVAADEELQGAYEDEDALEEFAARVDVVTVEFENIPARALEILEHTIPVRPGPAVLHHTQNRGREKELLARLGLPHARAAQVAGPDELEAVLERMGTPALLKSAGFGYDGKGQQLISGPGDREAALAQLAGGPGVLEEIVEFERELSVIVARGPGGEAELFGPVENRHRRRILDVSLAPASSGRARAAQARELALAVAEGLDVVGVLCVELFEAGGELLVNEIAPRPHNSGHLTIEACHASQFEQQLRAVCGLPLASFEQIAPAAMANLLGDLWSGGVPDWASVLGVDGVALHLYGKSEARPGRKMGHLTAVAASPAEAEERVLKARNSIARTG